MYQLDQIDQRLSGIFLFVGGFSKTIKTSDLKSPSLVHSHKEKVFGVLLLESGGGLRGRVKSGAMGVGHREFGPPCVGAKRAFFGKLLSNNGCSKSLTCLVPHPDA